MKALSTADPSVCQPVIVRLKVSELKNAKVPARYSM